MLWGPDTVLWLQHTAAGHNNQQHSLLTSRRITTLDLQISLVSYVATIKPRTKTECSLLLTLDLDRDTVLLLD